MYTPPESSSVEAKLLNGRLPPEGRQGVGVVGVPPDQAQPDGPLGLLAELPLEQLGVALDGQPLLEVGQEQPEWHASPPLLQLLDRVADHQGRQADAARRAVDRHL